MSAPEANVKTFFEVFEEELAAFGVRTQAQSPPGDLDDGKGQREKQPEPLSGDVITRAHDASLAGLSFSGGGIRSATFCLGVLQALADLHLLRKFHYLSTVSGGGYIGSWLIAWIHRRGGKIEEVERGLRTDWKQHPTGAPDEIRFLRQFSNYLTPKLGWLGADTWTVVAIYLRNVLLNMIALIAVLVLFLALPRLLGVGLSLPLDRFALALVFVVLLVLAAVFVVLNLLLLKRQQRDAWAGEWLQKGAKGVRELSLAAPTLSPEGEGVYSLGKEFRDFVLDLEFTLPRSDAHGRLILRLPEKKQAEQKGRGWEIQIGKGETGKFPRQPPEKWPLERTEPKAINCLRIVCLRQTFAARLNGHEVNASRARRDLPEEGGIELILPKEERPEFTSILLRPIHCSRWFSRQGWVQSLIVAPLLLAGIISTLLFGSDTSIPRLLKLPVSWSWLDQPEWIWWAVIATAVAGLAHAIDFAVTGMARAVDFVADQIRRRRSPATTKGESSPVVDVWWKKAVRKLWRAFWALLAMVAGGAVGGVVLGHFHDRLAQAPDNFWPRLVWAPPLFIVAVLLMFLVYIGLRGTDILESMREWWSRLGAWLLIYALFWSGLLGVAFYGPPLLEWLAGNLRTGLAALGFGWVATTLSGVFASASASTGRRTPNRWLGLLAKVAPYVFIVGLLAGLSWGVDRLLLKSPNQPLAPMQESSALEVNLTVQGKTQPPVKVDLHRKSPPPSWGELLPKHWEALKDAYLFPSMADSAKPTGIERLLFLLLGSGLVAAVLAMRLDVNAFSLHMLYRNRLARCYIGAANACLRNPNAFTGLDPKDDIELGELGLTKAKLAENGGLSWDKDRSGPYPIINCALNLVGGRELAWQQRKAASFVFTPRYCGYDFPDLPPGYCSTGPGESGQPPGYASSGGPVMLAAAMAISGAAASPNMGYHTSPAAAFLMTLFNVRLGWWIGNPRHHKSWRNSSPNLALPWLVAEMFGLTGDRGRYIYLSDGGHFENLGILELVRRRCRFIVACDAEEDGNFGFDGLGNAIEKCRTDLGIDIELNVDPIRQRDEHGHGRWHCAVGSIRYDKADPDAQAGTILYLKSSLTGDEPTDVLRYAARVAEFPHESTGDQWFGESQFESYRALGHHVAMRAFKPVDEPERLAGLTTERLFVNLAQRWYPPIEAIDLAFKRRGETLNALYETLRTDENLRFLSQQIYTGWRGLVKGIEDAPKPSPPPGPWLPEKYVELRAGFYFCNRLILLMEDIYHDLHLEQEYDHPDNRGWMNLFKHWAWARMFQTTWTLSAANCGARFQNFCARHLSLEVGRMELKEMNLSDLLERRTQPADSPLTYVEWQLLRSFFQTRRDLRSQAELWLIQLLPGKFADPEPSDSRATHFLQLFHGRKVREREKEPRLTAGVTVLRKRGESGKARSIIYLRVRDYMRRMGIARRALYRLLYDDMRKQLDCEKFEPIEMELLEPPPGGPARPTEEDRTSFGHMYRGVRLELEDIFGNDAKESLDFSQQPAELSKYWLKEEKRGKWLMRKNDDGSEDSEMFLSLRDVMVKEENKELCAKWFFVDGSDVPVKVTFDQGKISVVIRFLRTRAARDEMKREWAGALGRLHDLAAADGSATR